MIKKLNYLFVFLFLINIFNVSKGNENFFEEGLKLYNNEKYEDARFMFERSIVFNPKDSNSYLYLAKIYNIEEDQKKRGKKFRSNFAYSAWQRGSDSNVYEDSPSKVKLLKSKKII